MWICVCCDCLLRPCLSTGSLFNPVTVLLPTLPQEISKSNVVDDMVASNRLLYKEDEHPDHVVVIK